MWLRHRECSPLHFLMPTTHKPKKCTLLRTGTNIRSRHTSGTNALPTTNPSPRLRPRQQRESVGGSALSGISSKFSSFWLIQLFGVGRGRWARAGRAVAAGLTGTFVHCSVGPTWRRRQQWLRKILCLVRFVYFVFFWELAPRLKHPVLLCQFLRILTMSIVRG